MAEVTEPLWREVLGRQLRELRLDRGEKLTETAGRAGISPQYLSEVERGRKEPSSEMIAALAGAFGLTLIDLTTMVADDLRQHAVIELTFAGSRARAERRDGVHGRALRRPSGPVARLAVAA